MRIARAATNELVTLLIAGQSLVVSYHHVSHIHLAYTSSTDCFSLILDIREYDVLFHQRVCIDESSARMIFLPASSHFASELRVGQWYVVQFEEGVTSLTHRKDLEERAEVRVCAFDIETTKQPLKFPDPSSDVVMMISYMVDGQGFLIINR